MGRTTGLCLGKFWSIIIARKGGNEEEGCSENV